MRQREIKAIAERRRIKMRKLRDKFTDAEIAERFGISRQRLNQILGPRNDGARKP